MQIICMSASLYVSACCMQLQAVEFHWRRDDAIAVQFPHSSTERSTVGFVAQQVCITIMQYHH
jgi:hypothetical protein